MEGIQKIFLVYASIQWTMDPKTTSKTRAHHMPTTTASCQEAHGWLQWGWGVEGEAATQLKFQLHQFILTVILGGCVPIVHCTLQFITWLQCWKNGLSRAVFNHWNSHETVQRKGKSVTSRQHLVPRCLQTQAHPTNDYVLHSTLHPLNG